MRASPDWSRDTTFDSASFLGREALAQRRDHQQMQDWARENRKPASRAILQRLLLAPDPQTGKIMLRRRLRTSLRLGLLVAAVGAVYL